MTAKQLTSAQWTVLREATDLWAQSYANLGTISALEQRGLIEAQCRGRYGLSIYIRRTAAGRSALGVGDVG